MARPVATAGVDVSYLVIKVYSFGCDFDGCNEYSDDMQIAPADLAREGVSPLRLAWRWAYADGWRRKGTAHLCPKHATTTTAAYR
jgi:hypothetical protein